MDNAKYPYRLVTRHPPDVCAAILQSALDTQHMRGIEIRPGWKHCPRMVLGRVRGTKLKLYNGKIDIDSAAPMLVAEIFPHEKGSLIEGEFRGSGGQHVMKWLIRGFASFLYFGPLILLILGKIHDPEALSWLYIGIFGLLGLLVQNTLWRYAGKSVGLSKKDVDFLQRFIKDAFARPRQ